MTVAVTPQAAPSAAGALKTPASPTPQAARGPQENASAPDDEPAQALGAEGRKVWKDSPRAFDAHSTQTIQAMFTAAPAQAPLKRQQARRQPIEVVHDEPAPKPAGGFAAKIRAGLSSLAALFKRKPKATPREPAATRPTSAPPTPDAAAQSADARHAAAQARIREMKAAIEAEEQQLFDRVVRGMDEVAALPPDAAAQPDLDDPVWTAGWQKRVVNSDIRPEIMAKVREEHGLDHVHIMNSLHGYIKSGDARYITDIDAGTLNVRESDITSFRALKQEAAAGGVADPAAARQLATDIARQTWSMLGQTGPVAKAEQAAVAWSANDKAAEDEYNALMAVKSRPADPDAQTALRGSSGKVWANWEALVDTTRKLPTVMKMAQKETCLDQMTVMRLCWSFMKSGSPADLEAIDPNSLNVESPVKKRLIALQAQCAAEPPPDDADGNVIDLAEAREVMTLIANQTWHEMLVGGPIKSANTAIALAARNNPAA